MSDLDHPRYETAALPYRVAVLCYLWDAQDRPRALEEEEEPVVLPRVGALGHHPEQPHVAGLERDARLLVHLAERALVRRLPVRNLDLASHRRVQARVGLLAPVKEEQAILRIPQVAEHRHAVRERRSLVARMVEVRHGVQATAAARGIAGQHHWLLFLFECTRPVLHSELGAADMDEGTLIWVPTADVAGTSIPETDRQFMWPQVLKHRGGGFFVLDIDCSVQPHVQRLMESRPPGITPGA